VQASTNLDVRTSRYVDPNCTEWIRPESCGKREMA
jgi:hypothetical protein